MGYFDWSEAYEDAMVAERDRLEEEIIGDFEEPETAEPGEWVQCGDRLPTKFDEYDVRFLATYKGERKTYEGSLELVPAVDIEEREVTPYWDTGDLRFKGYSRIKVLEWAKIA